MLEVIPIWPDPLLLSHVRNLKHERREFLNIVAYRACVLEMPHIFPSQVSHVLGIELPLDLPLKVFPRLYGANVFLHIDEPSTLP